MLAWAPPQESCHSKCLGAESAIHLLISNSLCRAGRLSYFDRKGRHDEVSGSVSAAAATVINRFENLGNVVVTNWAHICIDNRRTAAMLVVNEC